MIKKIGLLLLCITLVIPTIVFADDVNSTTYNTSINEVVDKYEESNKDVDRQTTVLVSQSSTFKVSIPKTVSLDGTVNEKNENIGKYTVCAEGNISSDEVIIVKPMVKEFYMKDDAGHKSNIIAEINQGKINFVGIDTKTSKYSNNDTVEGMTGDSIGSQKAEIEGIITVKNLTAGNWTGTFDFHIQLSKSIANLATEVVNENAIPE